MANQSDAAAEEATRAQAPCVLYGLSCADCHAYYASSVSECPVCHSKQRITPSKVPGRIPESCL